ncbi:MAG: hypothetical protein MMC23_001774 [Stictis urceolatum]|nr:hypothetical protein [Stictis urceolata]
MTKSVAVVGAGPSGLVAAKTFLHSHPPGTFEVSIFEKTANVGGLWDTYPQRPNGVINPEMRTNVSKYTVAFSDLSWEYVNLRMEDGEAVQNVTECRPNKAPMFPKAWQVGLYLQRYYDRYIPPYVVNFNTRVLRAERTEKGSHLQWRLELESSTCEATSRTERFFDHLVIASGFFSGPRAVNFGLPVPLDCISEPTPRVIHSTHFRKLQDLWSDGMIRQSAKVLVIGGSYSGCEIAAAIAMQFSNARYSPTRHEPGPYEVIHICSQPLYALPLFAQIGSTKKYFTPIDFALYDYSTRPDNPVQFSIGKMTQARARKMRQLFSEIIGEADSGVAEGTAESEEIIAPYVAISESYSSFVNSGAIVPLTGRVKSLHMGTNGSHLRATVIHGESTTHIEDITAVVYATGYSPSTALNFLSDEVKAQLGFDSTCPHIPLLLEQNFITNSAQVPNLAFIGFTDAPYWGGIEMQARVTAHTWAKQHERDLPAESACQTSSLSDLRNLQESSHGAQSSIPQNWFGDYAGIMEEGLRALKAERKSCDWAEQDGFICPARYLGAGTDEAEAKVTMDDIQQTLKSCRENGLFVARAVFRGLHGRWKVSSLAGSSDHSTIEFHPRLSTDPDHAFEYLYVESTTGSIAEGKDAVSDNEARYIYRYSEAADQITIWSIKDDGFSAGYQLSYLDFATTALDTEASTWTARERPAEAKVGVRKTRRFRFSGAHMEAFSLEDGCDLRLHHRDKITR